MRNPDQTIENDHLFFISALALFTAALNASLRAGLAGTLKEEYIDPISLATSASLISSALGIAFTAFAITLLVASTLLDFFGMRAMLMLAAVTFAVGNVAIIVLTPLVSGMDVYWTIWGGMLLAGIGWGLVEATINPLTATLYPDDTTHRMNILHAWWPAGLIVGGLTTLGTSSSIDWRWLLASALIPAILLGVLCTRVKFPATARVQDGIPFGQMFVEILRRPSFLIWFFIMFLTSASELAPGQWVDITLSNIVGMRGIILLIYVSGLMFVMRHFAGPLAHRLSPVGLLAISSVFAAIGLYLLSIANSPFSAFMAATIWGIGVCYMWPTMIATVADQYPRGGSLAIGLIGTAGALSIGIVLPILGRIYDQAIVAAAGPGVRPESLTGAALVQVQAAAAAASFQAVAIIPASLTVIFSAIWVFKRWSAKQLSAN